MRIEGYKLNGYNATYEQTYFDVRCGRNGSDNRVLEVTDTESGLTFIFEPDDVLENRRHRQKIGSWRAKK